MSQESKEITSERKEKRKNKCTQKVTEEHPRELNTLLIIIVKRGKNLRRNIIYICMCDATNAQFKRKGENTTKGKERRGRQKQRKTKKEDVWGEKEYKTLFFSCILLYFFLGEKQVILFCPYLG